MEKKGLEKISWQPKQNNCRLLLAMTGAVVENTIVKKIRERRGIDPGWDDFARHLESASAFER
ncbi:MAG: hypothetical protein WCF08_10695 [Anaerolineaceae bacterium]